MFRLSRSVWKLRSGAVTPTDRAFDGVFHGGVRVSSLASGVGSPIIGAAESVGDLLLVARFSMALRRRPRQTFPGSAAALLLLGIFAAIYHPVGIPMLVGSQDRGRDLRPNRGVGRFRRCTSTRRRRGADVFGRSGAAFLVPAVICAAVGIAYLFLTEEEKDKAAVAREDRRGAARRRHDGHGFCLFPLCSLSRAAPSSNILDDRKSRNSSTAPVAKEIPLVLLGRLRPAFCFSAASRN